MLSRNTLIWIGAAALVVVAAGAGAVVWTHPGFLEPNPADIPLVAKAPVVPRTPAVSPAPATVPPAPPAKAQAPADKPPTRTAALEPAFDVVNVDPSGAAVIAGRAAPNEKVELRDAGKTVAEATADAAGQFVIIPPAPLAPGDHQLSLAANDGKAEQAGSSPVAVTVPVQEAKAAAPVGPPEAKPAAAAAPTNPNPEPSALGMRTLATPASASGSRVAIQSVEADAPDGLVAKGSAEPNSSLRLYLNQADIAEAETQSDGRWSLTIKGGMTPGGYVIQADEIEPAGAAVIASASTPFEYPDMTAATPPQAADAPTTPARSRSPADAVVEAVQTKRVVTGHTLWALSKTYYGDPTHYPVIYEANRAQIHNPNVIYPGQVFVVPKSDVKP